MEGSTYKAGIIGLGFIGAGDQVSGDVLGQRVEDLGGTHDASYARHSRVELVAGSSRDEGRRQRFSARTGGARTYADWQEMLDAEDLDIVSVATVHSRARGNNCRVRRERRSSHLLREADRQHRCGW